MSASTTAPLPRSTVPAENSVDARFGQLASEEQVRTAAAALEQNGIQVTVVKDRDEATRTALGLIPDGAKVLDAPSQTLVALGLDKTLAASTRFHPLRAEFMRLYQAQDFDGLRKL